ncbi:MAG: hypothetical protein ACO3FI_12130 [Cyclobacteriaceae bacterium]
MNDSMEEFFRRNRREMDSEIPGTRVWRGVQHVLFPKSENKIFWKVAAVFFFFCSAGLLIKDAYNEKIRFISENPHNAQAITGFEGFYTLKISQREAWISENFPEGTNPGIEYQRLVSMYEVLRLAWEKNPTDELRDALALNLIIRLDMLNRLTESNYQTDQIKMTGSGKVNR